jgi:hypothetical protein
VRFALVTPSYYRHYEVCRILVDSVHRHVPKDVPHYIIVSRDDLDLFRPLADDRTRVLVQEEIVQERFHRIPFARRWRINLRTPPVRGWIWQQMVKLSIGSRIDADAYVIIDSECFFVQAFDPRTLLRGDKVPFFREEKDWYKTDDDSQEWMRVSRRLLGLPRPTEPWGVGYVNSPVFWRRDVLLKLHERVSKKHGRNTWLRRVARQLRFSEYSLYGIFVDHILGLDAAGHYGFDRHISHDYWGTAMLGRPELAEFRARLGDEVIVMINGNSQTPVEEIREVFGV